MISYTMHRTNDTCVVYIISLWIICKKNVNKCSVEKVLLGYCLELTLWTIQNILLRLCRISIKIGRGMLLRTLPHSTRNLVQFNGLHKQVTYKHNIVGKESQPVGYLPTGGIAEQGSENPISYTGI